MAQVLRVNDTNLRETFETYKSLSENAYDTLARRYISSSLKIYLGQYLNYENGILQPLLSSERTQYLASLPNTHFDDLTEDLLEEIFRRGNVYEPDAIARPVTLNERALARKWISTLEEEDFNALIVDFAYEMDRRTAWLTRGDVGAIGLHHTSESTLVLHWSHRALGTDTYNIEMLLPSRLARPGFINDTASFATRFLRRALGTSRTTAGRPNSATSSPTPRRSKSLQTIAPKIPPSAEKLNPLSEKDEDDWLESNEDALPSLNLTNSNLPSYNISSPVLDSDSLGFHSSRSSTLVNSEALEFNEVVDVPARSSRRWSRDFSHGARCDWTLICAWNSSDSTLSNTSTFKTARSSIDSYISTTLGLPSSTHNRESKASSYFSANSGLDKKRQSQISTDYYRLLKERNLIPEPLLETDWSGRGQHAEYKQDEVHAIPLIVETTLGETRNALVQSVRCRRIRLARKAIRCNKWRGVKREDAIKEVEHLQRVQHSHIVRLVGTYVIGNELAILMYPCAEWNLEDFMKSAQLGVDAFRKCEALKRFFACLANTLDFMHSFPMKHMDIKPTNLLVRNIENSPINGQDPYKIYITDFGISRSYTSVDECETESPTSYTRAYAAREVILQELRGLGADVFSLGCVYAEMLAVVADCCQIGANEAPQTTHWDALQSARGRTEVGFRAYQAAVPEIRTWLTGLPPTGPELDLVKDWTAKMIDSDANRRPSAREIAEDPCMCLTCSDCKMGTEEFEAADPP